MGMVNTAGEVNTCSGGVIKVTRAATPTLMCQATRCWGDMLANKTPQLIITCGDIHSFVHGEIFSYRRPPARPRSASLLYLVGAAVSLRKLIFGHGAAKTPATGG